MHSRSSPVEECGNRSGRCRKTFNGLWISRTDDFVASDWDDDGRADRERTKTRARPFLRRDDLDPRRDRRGRARKDGSGKQYLEKRPAHGVANCVRKVGPAVLARTSGFSSAVDTRAQILARRRADRQCLRGQKPVLLLSTDRGISVAAVCDHRKELRYSGMAAEFYVCGA